jgi:hypothetical protein
MHLCTLSAALLFYLTACGPLSAQSPPPETTLITHVTVVDVATGTELKDQTVMLQGDRIVSVAASDLNATSEGRVIDAHGTFLIPALWDMHVHIQDLEDLPLYIANGVTGVRLMFGSKHTPSLRAKLASAPVAPEVIVGSAIVDGDPPVWEGSIVVKKPEESRRIVGEIKADGADFVKIYNGIPRDAYFALADEARKQTFLSLAICHIRSALRKLPTPASALSNISMASPSAAPSVKRALLRSCSRSTTSTK